MRASPAPASRTERRRRHGIALIVCSAAAFLSIGTAASVRTSVVSERERPRFVVLPPAVVRAPLRLDGALVRGAARAWALDRRSPVHYGDPVPVELTAYCLKGTTRRDRWVREGIVAADPRLFPLGRYVELYVGRRYAGRFLVDDTGDRIQGSILDIWTPECRDARRFGRRRGTAVLVPRPRGASRDTLLTGRLGGVEQR